MYVGRDVRRRGSGGLTGRVAEPKVGGEVAMADQGNDGGASPWPRPKERAERRALKREAVLRTSVRLFNLKGFHATSLDEVAAALEVTKPTLYHYFPSKDDILFECVRLGYEDIRLAAEAASAKGETGRRRLEHLLTDYAVLMTKDFGRCAARTTDLELSPASRQRFRALKREIEAIMRAAVGEGMADGSLKEGDVTLTTFTLIGALNWIAYWYDPEKALGPEAIAGGMVRTLMEGIVA